MLYVRDAGIRSFVCLERSSRHPEKVSSSQPRKVSTYSQTRQEGRARKGQIRPGNPFRKGQVIPEKSCQERPGQNRKVRSGHIRKARSDQEDHARKGKFQSATKGVGLVSDQKGHAMNGQVKAGRSCLDRLDQTRKVMP